MSFAKRLLKFLGVSLIAQIFCLSVLGYYVLSNDDHRLPASLVQNLTKIDQKILEGVALQHKLGNETARNLIAYELLELNGVDDVEFLEGKSVDQIVSRMDLRCRIYEKNINICIKPSNKDVLAFIPLTIGSDVVGHLKLGKSLNAPFVTKDIILAIVTILAAFILNMSFVIYFWFRHLRPDLHKLLSVIHSGVYDKSIQIKEYQTIQEKVVDSYRKNKNAEEERVKLERATERENISKQVVHDIKSPLTAIEGGLGRMSLSERDRDFFKKVLERAKDILADLSRGRSNKKVIVELNQFIKDLIEEKTVEYKDNANVSILFEDATLYPVFSKVLIGELGRCLSNLMNNAVEATDKRPNRITVSLSVFHGKKAVISISDNGKGIDEEKLNGILETGGSFEKPHGTGLGLLAAQRFIQDNQGTFSISSLVGQGTIVTLTLPLHANVLETGVIEINKESKIIIADDDSVIHLWWRRALRGLSNDVSFYHQVQDIPELDPKQHYVIFSDYDFGSFEENGFDCFRKVQDSRAKFDFYLVTGTDLSLIETDLIPAIIPKLNLENIKLREERMINQIILLDDEEITHLNWKCEAEKQSLNLISCYTPKDLFAKLANLKKKETPVYIDFDLGEEENGISIAQKVAMMGFTHIVLTTGYETSSIQIPSFIQCIQGKEFPLSHGL